MTLTKETLYRSLYNDLGFSKAQSVRLIESTLEIIKKALESGEDVLITGFGKFSIKTKRQRRGRNPATGDQMVLDARRIVTFKCSNCPPGFCNWAFADIQRDSVHILYGVYYPWMKEKGVAISCCTDGLRPVIFKIERIED